MAVDEPGSSVEVDAQSGEVGVPVDAICVGCQKMRVKKAPGTVDDPATSFKHACHTCQTTTWWNTVEVLEGLLKDD